MANVLIDDENKEIRLEPNTNITGIKSKYAVSIYCNGSGNIKFIHAPNVETLYCNDNVITELDIPNVITLSCSSNKLTLLFTPNAKTIIAFKNKLTTIIAPKAESIMASDNNIIDLNNVNIPSKSLVLDNNPLNAYSKRRYDNIRKAKKVDRIRGDTDCEANSDSDDESDDSFDDSSNSDSAPDIISRKARPRGKRVVLKKRFRPIIRNPKDDSDESTDEELLCHQKRSIIITGKNIVGNSEKLDDTKYQASSLQREHTSVEVINTYASNVYCRDNKLYNLIAEYAEYIICSNNYIEKLFAPVVKTLICNNNCLTELKSDAIIINCRDNSIETLYAPNAKYIDCKNNKIKSIYAPVATYIDCGNNKLISIDAPLCETLKCNSNELVSITGPCIIDINCSNNYIKKLDLPSAIHIECQFTLLEIISIPKVKIAMLNNNYIRKFQSDVIEELYCDNNELVVLIVPRAKMVTCNGNINLKIIRAGSVKTLYCKGISVIEKDIKLPKTFTSHLGETTPKLLCAAYKLPRKPMRRIGRKSKKKEIKYIKPKTVKPDNRCPLYLSIDWDDNIIV